MKLGLYLGFQLNGIHFFCPYNNRLHTYIVEFIVFANCLLIIPSVDDMTIRDLWLRGLFMLLLPCPFYCDDVVVAYHHGSNVCIALVSLLYLYGGFFS
jgi:hypothetical protein